MTERFNPKDPQYQHVGDLPDCIQDYFVEEEGQGFILLKTFDYESAIAASPTTSLEELVWDEALSEDHRRNLVKSMSRFDVKRRNGEPDEMSGTVINQEADSFYVSLRRNHELHPSLEYTGEINSNRLSPQTARHLWEHLLSKATAARAYNEELTNQQKDYQSFLQMLDEQIRNVERAKEEAAELRRGEDLASRLITSLR